MASNTSFDPEFREVKRLQDQHNKYRGKSLPELFKEALDLYNKISNSQEPTNSDKIQCDVREAINMFEYTTILVSKAEIFSTNENVEEIATNDLQYLLLPAFLGSLSLKRTTNERKEIVDVAEIYFKDFLQRCNEYGLSNYIFKDNEEENEVVRKEDQFEMLQAAVNTRASKIQRYREQKELKEKLEVLQKNLNNETVDEEIKRNYFLTMIKLFIHEAIDELSSIEMEKPILQHMAKLKEEKQPPSRQNSTGPTFKAIVITKDLEQKAEVLNRVFGAGYPAMPTLTVGEFYEQRVAEGWFPDPNKPKTGPMSLQESAMAGLTINDEDQETAEKEKMEEQEDEEYINYLRNQDEYKDTHRRGWGNRMNRS